MYYREVFGLWVVGILSVEQSTSQVLTIVLFRRVCAVGLAAEDSGLISGLVVGKSVGAEEF